MSLASSWFAQRLLRDALRTRTRLETTRNRGSVRPTTMSLRSSKRRAFVQPMSARRFSTTILVVLAAVAGAALAVGASGGLRSSAGRDRAPAGAARAPLLPPSTRRSAFGKLCDGHGSGPLVYHWPVKPFTRQHPVRGNFGDPRTVGFESIGTDGPEI